MPDKLRVLHVIPNLRPGGAERLLVSLLAASNRERFETQAVSLYPESRSILEQEVEKKGLKVSFLKKHRGPDLRMLPQLYRLFCVFRPHIVHTHLSVLRYTLLPALFCRIPVQVHTLHNVASREVDGFGKLVHWLAFRRGMVVPVSISSEVANTFRALYGSDVHTPVICNGIPTWQFYSGFAREVQRRDRVVLLHVGSFAPQKNHLLLIQAFAILAKEHPDMHLWLVGNGALRPRMERTVAEMGLEAKVVFWGVRDDVPRLLAASDVFVLSSDYEGMPLAVLEAMAAGKPVVATAVGGVPELVEDGVTGILVPPGETEALAGGILRVLSDPGLRESMGQRAQEVALERFDIARTAREYEALYSSLLEQHGRV